MELTARGQAEVSKALFLIFVSTLQEGDAGGESMCRTLETGPRVFPGTALGARTVSVL